MSAISARPSAPPLSMGIRSAPALPNTWVASAVFSMPSGMSWKTSATSLSTCLLPLRLPSVFLSCTPMAPNAALPSTTFLLSLTSADCMPPESMPACLKASCKPPRSLAAMPTFWDKLKVSSAASMAPFKKLPMAPTLSPPISRPPIFLKASPTFEDLSSSSPSLPPTAARPLCTRPAPARMSLMPMSTAIKSPQCGARAGCWRWRAHSSSAARSMTWRSAMSWAQRRRPRASRRVRTMASTPA